MIIDSGAAFSFLDVSLRKLILEEAGNAHLKLYRSLPLQVQSIITPNPQIALVDFRALRRMLGGKLDGLLGVPQLKSGKLLLNYDEGFLEVHTGGWKIDQKEYGEIAFDNSEANPTFVANIEGRPCELLFDTGDDGSISLETSDFAFLVKSGVIELSNVHGRIQDVSGLNKHQQGWFLKGELMGKSLRGISVMSVADASGAGTMGLEWIYGFNTEIDFASHRFRFQNRLKANSPLAFDLMIGAALSYDDNGAQVEALRPGGGAAEAAGLRPGDVVEHFGSLKKAELGRVPIGEVVTANAGKPIPIQFVRKSDGQKVDAMLNLPPPILAWDFAGRDIFNNK
jgi:hypothetical protein